MTICKEFTIMAKSIESTIEPTSATPDVAQIATHIGATGAELEANLKAAETAVAEADARLAAALESQDEEQVTAAQQAKASAHGALDALQKQYAEFLPDIVNVALLAAMAEYQSLIVAELTKTQRSPEELAQEKAARVKALARDIRAHTQAIWELEDRAAEGEAVESELTQAKALLAAAESEKARVESAQPGARQTPPLPESLKLALSRAGVSMPKSAAARSSGAGTGRKRSGGAATGADGSKKSFSPLGNGGSTDLTPNGKACAAIKSGNKKWTERFGHIVRDGAREIDTISNGIATIPQEYYVYRVKHPVQRDQWLFEADGRPCTVTAPDAWTSPRELAYQAQLRLTGYRGDQLPAGTVISGLANGETYTVS